MRFAVIGDIHSNSYALKSVLEDIKLKNVDFIISTGDLVGYFMYPNEVIELLKKNKVLVVQGNHDKAIAQGDKIVDISVFSESEIQKNASEIYTNYVLTDENRDFLNDLPQSIKLKKGKFGILIVHGSPRKIDEYLYEDETILKEISENFEENVIISGHTHIPYVKDIGEKCFINSGSVGKPKHGNPNSTYVILSIAEENLECSIEEVEYNYEKIVEDIKNNKGISDKLISMIREGN